MRPTVKERILLHLLERGGQADSIDAPEEATQPKIAEAVGIEHRHVSQYIRPLLAEGLLQERRAHVKGIPQRRRAYALSDGGRLAATRLRKSVESDRVRVRDASGEREATVAEIRSTFRGIGILRIVREIGKGRPVDLTRLAAPPETKTVEMLADAPDVRNFVGRGAELDSLTSEGETGRVFVVRGIAGIGKTALAAQACVRLRGTRNLFWHRVRPWDTRQSVLLHIGEFLAALGKPGLHAVLVRGKADRAAEVLREDLPGTHGFLVFDDAHEATDEVRQAFRMILETVARAGDVRVVLLSRKALRFYDRRDVVLRPLVYEMTLAGLEMSEVFAYLSADGGPILSAPFRRRMLSHPLLLELCRARRAFPEEAGADVRQFLEEVLYLELEAVERKMAGVASLYEVPVPRDALFADPRWSHDVLLSLANRSLIRAVGEGRFESHDTIREAFAPLLTPGERRRFGGFAVRQLKALASGARDANRFATCVDYLTNALHLSASATERGDLWEDLGDANARMADLLGFSVAYRAAMKDASGPDALARRLRKLAAALCNHGELDAALEVIGEGAQALGEAKSVERAWFDLLRSRVCNLRFLWRDAIEPGERALRAFRDAGDVQGESEACLELGEAASGAGKKSPTGAPEAPRYFEDGLRLSDSLGDARLRVLFRVRLAAWAGHRHGDSQRVSTLLEEAEGLLEGVENPVLRGEFLRLKCWFLSALMGDFLGAEPVIAEAIHIARQIRDAAGLAEAEYLFAHNLLWRWKIREARTALEEAARDSLRIGAHPDRVLTMLAAASECYLMEGDRGGFRRICDSLEGMGLAKRRWPYLLVMEGFDRLLEGDDEAAQADYEEALRTVEKGWSGEEAFFRMNVSLLDLYCAMALTVVGKEGEAAVHRDRAFEVYRTYGFRGRLLTSTERERRVVAGIKRIRAAS